MKKYKNIGIDIILCLIVAVSITGLISPIIMDDIIVAQELNQKNIEQLSTKAQSMLDGNGESIKSSQITYPKIGDNYALIHNDDRGFSKDLYFGDNTKILDLAIGTYDKGGIPGLGKPILLAGHNGTHFILLPDFEIGDHVQIDTTYGKYVYEVYDMKTMHKDDFDTNILNEKEELLILYTCYPFNVVKTDQRYFVYAKKVVGPIIEEDGSWKE